jgi:hypothetical protein
MLSLRFLRIEGIIVEINRRIMQMIPIAETGRVKKITKLPSDKINECRREYSTIGPSTNARINGAPSYLNFFIRYPRTPNINIKAMSKTLLLTL